MLTSRIFRWISWQALGSLHLSGVERVTAYAITPFNRDIDDPPMTQREVDLFIESWAPSDHALDDDLFATQPAEDSEVERLEDAYIRQLIAAFDRDLDDPHNRYSDMDAMMAEIEREHARRMAAMDVEGVTTEE